MKFRPRSALAAAATLALALTVTGATAGSGSAAPGLLPAQWVGAWSATPTAVGPNGVAFAGLTDQSVRMVVHTTISGESVRIRVSNAFGDRHLSLGHASVALPVVDTPTERRDADPATVRPLTFSGSTAVVVPKGGEVVSDPVAMTLPALQDLIVTLYFPVATGPSTFHALAASNSYVGAGDLTGDTAGTPFTITRNNFYFLSEVEVLSRRSLGSVVILGDSIADGVNSTFNANARWPDRLAQRLISERPFGPFEVGVLNEGVGGNQLGHDGSEVGAGSPALGLNGLARLDRDVLGQTGVRLAVVCLGVNDIQLSNDSADRIILLLRQAAAQIRAHNLIAVGCTIMPFGGFPAWTPEKEATRLAVNQWLRSTGDFHRILDFDAAMRDPAQPERLRPEWDSGDHIHPNDAGYQAMANAVPLGFMR